MNIEFHQGAKANFDAKGEDLLQRARPFEPPTGATASDFRPDLHATAVITEKDIAGPVSRESINPLTWKVTQIVFEGTERLFLLDEPECNDLEKMAEAIAKLPALREHVSRLFVRRVILDWIEARSRDQATSTLMEYLSYRAASEVKSFEAWFPIGFLHVESGFSLGRVTFRSITREFLDEVLETASGKASEEEKAKIRDRFEHRRSRLQGRAAAVLTFEAERSYAIEAGLEISDTAVALLRVLHPGNVYPGALLHCRTLGRENVESYEVLFVGEDGKYLGAQSQMLIPFPSPWELSDMMVEKLRPEGLDALHALLSLSEQSQFQQELLDALLIYSRNNITREPADKLIAILVALESLLLRNDSEPIQQNIGDRMAFMLGSTVDERLSIIRLVKDVYTMRSRFIHHGESLNDLELLQKFMSYSWILFLRLLQNHSRFKDRLALLDDLDRRKYS